MCQIKKIKGPHYSFIAHWELIMINNAAEHHFMHILEKNWAALNITLDVKWCCTNSQNYFLVLPASSWCILRVRDKITLSTKGCAISCLTFIVLLYLIAKHPISHLQKRLYSLRKRMILQKDTFFVVTRTKRVKEKEEGALKIFNLSWN